MPLRIGSVVSVTTFCVSAESSFICAAASLELLALMRERHLEQLRPSDFASNMSRARSNAVLALARAISISLARYSAEPRLAQEIASSNASVECSTTPSSSRACPWCARPTFRTDRRSEDGISAAQRGVRLGVAFVVARAARGSGLRGFAHCPPPWVVRSAHAVRDWAPVLRVVSLIRL